MHGLLGEIGDEADHARHREAVGRHRAVGVITIFPVRIAHNGRAPYRIEGDALRGQTMGSGDGKTVHDQVRVGDCPLQRLHAAHRPTADGVPARDAQVVHQQALRVDHIADGDHGKIGGIRLPGGGIGLCGPVLPMQPPMTLAHTR